MAYTPPVGSASDFAVTSGYTPSVGSAVNFSIGSSQQDLTASYDHKWIITQPAKIDATYGHKWIQNGPTLHQASYDHKWTINAPQAVTGSFVHLWVLPGFSEVEADFDQFWALNVYSQLFADYVQSWTLNAGLVEIEAPRAGYTPVYRLTVTDPGSGLPDLQLYPSNFQARVRSGTNSYLTATISGVDQVDAINARADGEFYIEGWLKYADGSTTAARELARANIDRADTFRGGGAESIVLTGYKQTTYITPKLVKADQVITKIVQSGVTRWRAPPNFYLRPLDTFEHQSQQITVSQIVYTVGPRQSFMDVSDATG